jgi:hypothetical protein
MNTQRVYNEYINDVPDWLTNSSLRLVNTGVISFRMSLTLLFSGSLENPQSAKRAQLSNPNDQEDAKHG